MSLFRGVKNALPYVVRSSKGHIVKTVCGKELLDLTCGIGVTNLGHSHPRVTAAAQAACGNLVHAQQNIARHEPMMELIGRLSSTNIAQKAGLDSWFYWGSGAEAVEASIKLARHATGKPNIVTMNLGYHGRTFMTMALTASGTTYRSGFSPLPSGVHQSPFPYAARSPLVQQQSSLGDDFTSDAWQPHGCVDGETAAKEVERCLAELELLLRTQTAPSETAAVIIEPVLGEGGYVPPPPGYLEGVRAICDREGILLIIDEVQTGFGRTGTMFASEWLGVKPDIMVCAKGLANGFPLSAIGTRKELSDLQPPGSMGGTYGGNAVACAAANAVMQAFEDEKILDNVMLRGEQARKQLQIMALKHKGLVREVRGRGLMLGIEFQATGSHGFFENGAFTFGQFAGAVASKCWEKNLIVLSCGPYDTLRLIPPLNISEADLKICMDVFDTAVDEVVATHRDKIKA